MTGISLLSDGRQIGANIFFLRASGLERTRATKQRHARETEMITPEECLANAEECEDLALATLDHKAKALMLWIAAEWRRLAPLVAPTLH